jgi:hypothetical protein
MSGLPAFAERLRRAVAAFTGKDETAPPTQAASPPAAVDAPPPSEPLPEQVSAMAPTPPPEPVAIEQIVAQSWKAWLQRVDAQLQDPGRGTEPSDYESVLLAALSQPPGSLFRANISQMTLFDWNALAIAGLPYPKSSSTSPSVAPAPRWALILALSRLGFDAAVLRAQLPDQEDAESAALTARLIQSAPIGRKGILIVDEAPGYVDLAVAVATAPAPVLALSSAQLPAYGEALSVLHQANAFSAVVSEAPKPPIDMSGLPAIDVPRDSNRPHSVSHLFQMTAMRS